MLYEYEYFFYEYYTLPPQQQQQQQQQTATATTNMASSKKIPGKIDPEAEKPPPSELATIGMSILGTFIAA